MIDMEPISPLWVCVFYLICSLIEVRQKRYELAYASFFITVWYFYIFIHPEVAIQTQRLIGRWCIWQYGFIYVLSYFVRKWYAVLYRRAGKQ